MARAHLGTRNIGPCRGLEAFFLQQIMMDRAGWITNDNPPRPRPQPVPGCYPVHN